MAEPPSKKKPSKRSSGKLKISRGTRGTKGGRGATQSSSTVRKASAGSKKLAPKKKRPLDDSRKMTSLRNTATRLKPVGAKPAGSSTGISDRVLPTFHVVAPIWLKFAGFTCALLSFFLIIFGILSSSITQREMNEQINVTGKKLALFVATNIGPFWDDDEDNSKKIEAVQAKLQAYIKRDSDIRDILILKISQGGKLSLMATARPDKNRINLDSPLTIEEGEGFTIQQSEIDGVLTRVFSIDLKRDGETVGKAQVYLKASKIQEVKDSLINNIIWICVIGILLGAVLTFLVTKFLTSPLQSLVEDIRIVSSGDLDHQTYPRSRDEIGELASIFNEMTQRLKVAKDEEIKKKAFEHELEIATEIQTKLLPERLPQIPGYDIFVYYLSAKHVGGDYYDFIVIDPKHLGIIVADVSGKGVPGSMVMTMARSLIRLASRKNPSPADTMKKVNKILAQDMRRGMFVTANYMVLNVQTRVLNVSSAGHNPLVVYRAQTQDIELIKPQGIALGFDKGGIFDANMAEEKVQLYKGDRVVSYTDGVVEAMSIDDEEFGDDTFHHITRQYGSASSKEYVNLLVQALANHRGEAEQSDDITISTFVVE